MANQSWLKWCRPPACASIVNRRLLLDLALLLALTACAPHSNAHGKRVIVIGVDAMDPNFVENHRAALPNLKRLHLSRLATTTPPQSPVAWATFITGTDPAQHGLFDFVHRDPATMQPVSSFAEVLPPAHELRLGPYLFPLSQARVRSFRLGRPFWEILTDHGIPATIIRMPTNYPPMDKGRALAGMGTPDLRGTFGTFTYYTDDPFAQPGDVSGGEIVTVTTNNSRVLLPIEGPPNSLRADHRPTSVKLACDIDPDAPAMRCQVDGQQFIVKQNEWSPWIRVRFSLIPGLASTSGIFRIYARELHPTIRIYRSPLNVDPSNPALPISTPANFSRDLAARIGPFYTQGIEEDTSALRQGALDLPEYLEQSRLIMTDHAAMLKDALDHFGEGLLFFYFSEVDQNSHVLWGQHDDELLKTYQAVDRQIGTVLDRAAGATVIVMSDHGFAAFTRAVNLNTWLQREGFLQTDGGHIDWKKTKAYAMGLNALYINLSGREKNGIVAPGAVRDAMVADLEQRLKAFRDPATEEAVVRDVTRPGPSASRYEPDLIVGYAPPYRASWETALGEVPDTNVIEPNRDAWIADHCIAASAVPGVLLGQRPPGISDPQLKDLTVTILKEFGVAPDPLMKGRPVY
ncbi:MAG TPA: alkaline phosphatase family protein [Bryobacteraceae bacterium]|nr:alkaline phosphatase family protein [Bryobacteraceae bacterium]